MAANVSGSSFGIMGIMILVVVVALGGYFYGRDTNRGDGNDIRIDLPDGPHKK